MDHPFWLYVIIGGMSCGLTLFLVPMFRSLAKKLDVVDRPSEARKVHQRVIPYLGGLPFYICFLVTILLIEYLAPRYSNPLHFPIALMGTIIVLMGIYDDIMDLGSLKKLIIELVLMTVFYIWVIPADGVQTPFGLVSAPWLTLLITPIWIAGVINAINFSDGLDGLAAGLVFICSAAIFAINFTMGNVAACIMMVYLMGTTLGFLFYNFNPASIFMGDAGALFLGYVLGISTLVQHQKGVTAIALAVPMVVMAIPILDTILSFYRRLQRARRGEFFSPDRDHLHHRLLDMGLTQRQVVLALYYISACAGLMAYIISVVPADYHLLTLILAAMAVSFGVAVLRFIESLAMQEPAESGEKKPDEA